MKRLFSWIVMIPLAVAVVAFSVANRDPVAISLWPAPFTLPPMPLALIVLGAIAAGTVIGLLLAWLSGGRSRAKFQERLRAKLGAEFEAKIEAKSQENAGIQRALAEKQRPVPPPAGNARPPATVSAAILPPPPSPGGPRAPANGA